MKSVRVGDIILHDSTTGLQRLEAAKRDPQTMERVAYLVAEGDSLKEIAGDMGVPFGMFKVWIAQSEDRTAIYQRALKLRADDMIHEALEVADAPFATDDAGDVLIGPDGVPIQNDIRWARLQVAARFKAAEKWDADRFGARINRQDIERQPTEGVGELARRLAQAFAAKGGFVSKADGQPIEDIEEISI